MFCTHCGSQIDENMKFCTNCGQPVELNSEATAQDDSVNQNSSQGEWNSASDMQQDNAQQTYQQQQTYQTYQQPDAQKPNTDQYKLFLQIFTGIFAVIFAIQFISGLVSGIGTVFSMFGDFMYYNAFAGLLTFILGVLALAQAVVSLASAATLGLSALKCEKENSESFFTTLAVIRIVSLALVLITIFIGFIYSIAIAEPSFWGILSFIGAIVFNVIVVGGMYGILHLMGEQPLKGVNGQNLQETVKTSVNDVVACAKSLQQNKAQTQTVYTDMNQNTQQGTYSQNDFAQNNANQNAYSSNTFNQQSTMNQGFTAPTGAAMMNTAPLKTDRNIVIYVLLTFVTCGIYAYYFIYKMAQDVNVACDGDGETTPGLLMFVLLSFVTCGIYAYFWYYKLANRLAKNAPRYGLQFQENGTTVLMWIIFGMLLCGIGTFVGLHIVFKNTNQICAAYNRMHFGN